MSFADANFLDVIAEGQAAILSARTEQVLRQEEADAGVRSGALRIRVQKTLTPERWHGPEGFDVRFAQFADPKLRVREGSLGWNGVDVQSGKFLLLALPDLGPEQRKAMTLMGPLSLTAVAGLESADDPMIQSTERILVIESTKDAKERTRLIREGLGTKQDFLAAYCHYAMGRLGRIPRDDAVKIETDILKDENRSVRDRLDAQANLELELWKEDEPDDPINRRILESFFQTLPARDPGLRRALLLAIHSMLVDEAPEGKEEGAAYRRKLMRGVSLLPKETVGAVLTELERSKDTATEAAWLREFISNR